LSEVVIHFFIKTAHRALFKFKTSFASCFHLKQEPASINLISVQIIESSAMATEFLILSDFMLRLSFTN